MGYLKTLTAACVCGLMSVAAPASAETLRLATIAPEQSVWFKQMKEFADAVNASDTGVQVELYAGGQLGNMADTFKNTLSGRLDIWVGAMPVMAAVVPELGTFALPYMFETDEEAKCVVPQMTDAMRDVIGKKFHLLTPTFVGAQDVNGVDPIRTPSDLKGVKIRTAPIPASMAFFKSMGATPQPLPASETPSALSTGLVSALDFDSIYYTLTGTYKTAKYHTTTAHNTNLGAFIISTKSWAKLSDAQKAALQTAADELDFLKHWDDVVAFRNVMLQKALSDGAEDVQLNDAEKAAWVAAGKAVWDEVIDGMRGDPRAFIALIDEKRAACQ